VCSYFTRTHCFLFSPAKSGKAVLSPPVHAPSPLSRHRMAAVRDSSVISTIHGMPKGGKIGFVSHSSEQSALRQKHCHHSAHPGLWIPDHHQSGLRSGFSYDILGGHCFLFWNAKSTAL